MGSRVRVPPRSPSKITAYNRNSIVLLPRSLTLGSRWEARFFFATMMPPASTSPRGVIMDSFLIGVALVVALYVAVRLVLRHYFPPDT